MPRVIAVSNLKGGANKSTLAINLAVACSSVVTTMICDLDIEQQAAARWSDAREAKQPAVISPVYTRLEQAIAGAGQGIDLIILDCPAFQNSVTAKAVSLADLVLVPCRTTVQDLQYLDTTMSIVGDRSKPAAIVFSSVESAIKETKQAAEFASSRSYPVAPMFLSKAVAYHRAITAGMGVTEYDPSSRAAGEITALRDWVCSLLGLGTTKPRKLDASNAIALA
jgi:chromosome partitioning protein